ncbi:hypothetical protein OHR68_36535 [Spirillospora sp. NBC_00431]
MSRGFWKWSATVVAAAVTFSAVSVLPNKAEAAPSANAAAPVINGPIFNNPLGSPAERRTVIDQLVGLIEATQPGGEIIVVMHEWMSEGTAGPAVVKALKAADSRSVMVKVILDSELKENPATYSDLAGTLGTDTSGSSWALLCPRNRGCIAGTSPNDPNDPNDLGDSHNKFAIFSKLEVNGKAYGSAVFQSSSNLHDWYLDESFNDAYTLASDKRGDAEDLIYGEYRRYAFQLLKGAGEPHRNDNYASFFISPYRLRFFPRREATAPEGDPMVETLNNIDKCQYSAAGQARTTKIDLALTHFTNYRIHIADKLAQLATQGCDITIIGSTFGSKIEPKLKSAPLDFRGACHIGAAEVTSHTKITMINGPFKGDTTPRVITGSANFTMMSRSDDAELMIVGGGDYEKYARWYENLKDACASQ